MSVGKTKERIQEGMPMSVSMETIHETSEVFVIADINRPISKFVCYGQTVVIYSTVTSCPETDIGVYGFDRWCPEVHLITVVPICTDVPLHFFSLHSLKKLNSWSLPQRSLRMAESADWAGTDGSGLTWLPDPRTNACCATLEQ